MIIRPDDPGDIAQGVCVGSGNGSGSCTVSSSGWGTGHGVWIELDLQGPGLQNPGRLADKVPQAWSETC